MTDAWLLPADVGPGAESNVTTIRVISAAEEVQRQPWKHPAAKVFDVTAYGPHGQSPPPATELN